MIDQSRLGELLHDEVTQSISIHCRDLSNDVGLYLTQMLAEFVRSESLFSEYRFEHVSGYGLEPITFQVQRVSVERPYSLRELGDHCLFLVGYFYDFIRAWGNDNVNYHCSVGASSYNRYGSLFRNEPQISNLFSEMALRFSDLGKVIGDLRLSEFNNDKKLFKLLERYGTVELLFK
ncbi:MAG: hypothetical protein ABH824_00590 [Nanoarchaeota archaeon]|nr:hypothetical protein [Nanoarchaeota archaeon]